MTQPSKEAGDRARVRVFHEGVQVWRLGEGSYVSPSKSELGFAYHITPADDGALVCDCPSALYRGSCKHQAAVEMAMEAETRR